MARGRNKARKAKIAKRAAAGRASSSNPGFRGRRKTGVATRNSAAAGGSGNG